MSEKNFVFQHRAVSNSGSTNASINNPNSIGNAQEYLASLYINKQNLFVEIPCFTVKKFLARKKEQKYFMPACFTMNFFDHYLENVEYKHTCSLHLMNCLHVLGS